LKIIFIGTPGEAANCLIELNKIFDVVFVYTRKDKIRDRGTKKTFTPVKKTAIELKIDYSTSEPNSEFLKTLEAGMIILCAYGAKLKPDIINSVRIGAYNIHPSLLPKYRGASPVITAILQGEQYTGVSVMKMDEGLDTGNIVAQSGFIQISSEDTAGTLTNKLFQEGTKLVIKTISKLKEDKNFEIPQNNQEASFTKIIRKEDGRINWNERAEEIEREIRAYNPWPMAFSSWNNKNLKIIKAEISEHISKKPGSIINREKKVFVATKMGSLELQVVQIEGKSPIKMEDFINGYPSFIGSILDS